jgi:superfamily II DNA or RNA helicase
VTVLPTRRGSLQVAGAATPVPVRIGADLAVRRSDLSPEALSDLHRELTRPNPEYAYREAAGRAPFDLVKDKAGKVIGRTPIPRDLCFVTEAGGYVRAPRGAIGILRSVLIRNGRRIDPRPEVVWTGAAPLPADAPRGAPGRDYQIEGEDRLLGIYPGSAGVSGGIVLPCGGGKTFLGARALVRSQQAGIVVVHTRDLLDQWVDALGAVSGRKPRRVQGDGVVYDQLRPGEHAVAMVQTLSNAGVKAAPLLRSAGVYMVDEAHHAPAATYAGIIPFVPARYRWWLSATPEREDGLGFILPWVMGPVLLRRTSGELARDGYLVLPRVLPVRTGWAPDPFLHYSGHGTGREPRLDWTATSKGIAEDGARNALIVRLAVAAARGGRTVLVLVSLVEHAEALASQIASCGVGAAPITGDVGKADRKNRLQQLRAGILQVAVATSLADEGLDVPRLGCLISAAPSKTWGRNQQRVGRLTRPHGDKGAGIAIDLVDGGPLATQYRRRARAYEEALGYPPEGWTMADAACAILDTAPTAPGLF